MFSKDCFASVLQWIPLLDVFIALCVGNDHKGSVRDFSRFVNLNLNLLNAWLAEHTNSFMKMKKIYLYIFLSSLYFSLCAVIHSSTLCGSSWQIALQHRRWHGAFRVSCNSPHSVGAGQEHVSGKTTTLHGLSEKVEEGEGGSLEVLKLAKTFVANITGWEK